MAKRVLYISRSGLPINAAGIRTFNIGNLLEQLGYKTHYIVTQRLLKNEMIDGFERTSSAEQGFLLDEEIHFKMGEKLYSYLPAFCGNKIDAAKEVWELLKASHTFKRVCHYCEKEAPQAIFLYNDAYALTKKLLLYCKKKNIKLFADVTEWYERDKNKTFAEKMLVELTEKRIVKLDHKLDGVIAISHYFEEYYKTKGTNCVRIPPLMQFENGFEIKRHDYYTDIKTVNFVYAGSPGGKDILIPFVKALQEVNKDGIKARIDIVGISGEYFKKFPELDQALEETGVITHGRLSREDTIDIVKKADFGVLFRHDMRYAKAGFSTKFAECMSVGVPMICNKIGGSDAVINNWENGIVTQTADSCVLKTLIERLCGMSNDEILRMKKSARSYAEKHFSGEKYISVLEKMIELEDD